MILRHDAGAIDLSVVNHLDLDVEFAELGTETTLCYGVHTQGV